MRRKYAAWFPLRTSWRGPRTHRKKIADVGARALTRVGIRGGVCPHALAPGISFEEGIINPNAQSDCANDGE